jgi:glyoxylase-like metal-dependent hydrolase (beta-lactamase superfamily II)
VARCQVGRIWNAGRYIQRLSAPDATRQPLFGTPGVPFDAGEPLSRRQPGRSARVRNAGRSKGGRDGTGRGSADLGPSYHDLTMHPAVDISRRTFLVHAGRGTIALAVLSVAGCGPAATASPSGGPESDAPSAPASGAPSASASNPPSSAGGGITWQRASFGFVSAYVLARGGEAAIVDTGEGAAAATIEGALTAAGLGWDAVGHVILTHRHGDHVGGLESVLAAAPDAIAYAGEADIPSISSSKPLTAVADGEEVFDLTIVATPGHTAGHIAVFDEAGGILVAGDALNNSGGTLAGSSPQFTEDQDQAKASVVKLGGLTFEVLLVGHGEPITQGASAQVAALAAAG